MKERKLADLFGYRSVWMGFAIIWIIIYHSELPVDNRLLWMVKNVGYCGVDIFLFASGLGCFYSYKKYNDAYLFMKRRIRRIIPTYWVFLTVYYIYHYFDQSLQPQFIVSNYLCIEFFKDPELETAFNWYICAIWVLYLLVPFFYKYIEHKGNKSLLLVPVLLFVSLGCWHSDNLILLGTRVPVFFLGMYYEKLALEGKTFDHHSLCKHLAAFAAGFLILVPMRLLITDNTIMWGDGFLFYPFLLMTPCICIVISLLCQIQHLDFIIRMLRKAGEYSLELYFVHHLVFEIGAHLLYRSSFYMTRLYWLVLYLAVIPSAWMLRIITRRVSGSAAKFFSWV